MESLEFYWRIVYLLCRAFPKETEISGWSVCDFHLLRFCKTTGTNTGYRFFSVQSYFNTSLLSEVVI